MPAPTVEIELARIHTSKIRILGDSAPGDMRTTRTDDTPARCCNFIWQESLGAVPQLFPSAPPGVYSELDLDLGGELALVVTGRASRGGTLFPFEVRSDADIPVNIPVNIELIAREFATAKIEVDVAAFIKDVDWDTVSPTPDGRLFIGDGDPGMATVVPNVATAFKFVAN